MLASSCSKSGDINMKQTTDILRGRPWLWLLVVLFVWLLPQQATARERYPEMTSLYQVMLNGSNKVRIQAPAYDKKDNDYFVYHGYLKAKWKDEKKVDHEATVLYWSMDEGYDADNGGSKYDNDNTAVHFKFKTEIGGSVDVKQGNSSSTFKITKDDGEKRELLYENSDDYSYEFSAVWTFPYEMYGCDVTFVWDVEVEYTHIFVFNKAFKLGLKDVNISLPEAPIVVNPQMSLGMMSFTKPGMLEVPWFVASDRVTSAKYEYVDHNDNTVSVPLQSGISNGTIYLDASVPHKNLHVIVDYIDRDNNPITAVTSDGQTQPVIHIPMSLTAKPLGDRKASVQLDWHIAYTEYEDISSSDFFEIQRSLTGKEADFETIFSEPFSLSQSNYTFIDSTLIDAIGDKLLKDGTLDSLTYRVRRTMTQAWGWGHSGAPSVRCVVDGIHLMHIATYSAEWEDTLAYTARVSWKYADEYNMVWDNRANMMMRVTMLNQSGDTVNIQNIEISPEEREQRYKVIDLSRTCVSYKVDLYIDRRTSPIPTFDEIKPYWFPIRNANDWKNFLNKVKAAEGKYDVNARLYADISIENSVGLYESYPYRGTFDGNGHTLNVNISGGNLNNLGIFRFVDNATFRNLHTTGTINTSQKYAGSLIGRIRNGHSVVIEGCRSSVTLNNSINGDATMGGFLGIVGDNASVMFRNCKFDGSFNGDNCSHVSGFIGCCLGNSSATIDNCLFAPDHITTSSENCATWARKYDSATLTVINSYATREYTQGDGTAENPYRINSAGDWNALRDAVEAAKNNSYLYARLEADITVSDYVGRGHAAVFRGTFDGNGHTLNVDINRTTDTGAVAPFAYAGDCTIKNLRVTGKVNGNGNHAAGLIGGAQPGTPHINLDRVWVSTDVTTAGTHVGGIIGYSNNGIIKMTDCLYDGKPSTRPDNEAHDTFMGTMIGWGNENTQWTLVRTYDHGNLGNAYWRFYGIWWNSPDWHSWGTNDRSFTVTQHGWDNVNYYNKTDQTEVVDLMNSNQAGTWQLVDGKAVPVLTTTDTTTGETNFLSNLGYAWTKEGSTINPTVTTTAECEVVTYPEPTLPTFYHEGNGKIGKTLMTETRQSSVVVTWDVEGVVDFFQVYRRTEGSGDDAWELIADQLDNTGYEDKSVSPLLRYEYKVRAVTDCEGLHYSETQVKAGACKNTGRVSGYVRLNDGTGVPGITVTVKHDKDANFDTDKSYKVEVITDETGYFVADGLPYNGLSDIEYVVSVTNAGNVKFETGKTLYSVTFDNETNDESIPEFTIINSHRFSGFVMYDGTSIPVKGAHFKVGNHHVYNASGKLVETDYDGSFSFRVLDGQDSIQVWMDKHTFTEDGYYLDTKKNKAVITDDEAGIYFYDATKVKLIGRVVGGDDQGSKPMDNNLSKNNLGRNLTMVMTLEGDNTSWLVYDNLNPELKTRELTFTHAGGNGHQTTAVVERKRMTVKPDSLTGEYTLLLPPVRWKVEQVYCDGYPTLFQEGQASEVIDLTDCLTPIDTTYVGSYKDYEGYVSERSATYNAIYNRIYHAPVEITYRQIGYDTFDYFGDRTYMSTNIGSKKVEVPLVSLDSITNTVHYTFGYPVFSLNRRYPIQVQVAERYPFNNDTRTGIVDIVPVGGGKVTVHNGLKYNASPETVELDSLGQGHFYITADQTARLLTGENALMTVTMTLEQDGTTYEAEPLKAYTLNMFALGGAKDVLVKGKPILIDILRDPPGGGSSATLSKGSTLKYSYTLDMTIKGGVSIGLTYGTKYETFTGFVNAPEGSGGTNGYMSNSDIAKLFEFEYAYNADGRRSFTYTMNVNEDITTSSDPNMVGAEADLFIGMTQNIVIQPLSTIRAIPDSIFQQMKGRLNGGNTAGFSTYGTLVDIAEGKDLDGNKFHLVRDESIGYGPEVTSHFIHSQKHILTQIIPQMVEELRALMFTGTAADAQKKADATGKPVYRSLVTEDDENFGLLNMKDGEVYYYTSKMKEEPGMNYVIHLPSTTTTPPTDEVAEKCQNILAWAEMIGQNEREKLAAIWGSSPMANYDVDGGTKVNYSEQFISEYSISNHQTLPGVFGDNWFDNIGSDMGLASSAAVGVKILAKLVDMLWAKSDKKTEASGKETTTNTDDEDNPVQTTTEVSFAGKTVKFRILPVLNYATKGVSTDSKVFSRKESFNIVMDKKSHLNFDVYRVQTDTAFLKASSLLDVYSNQNYDEMTKYVDVFLRRKFDMSKVVYSRSFVYRTRGGATVNSWEDQRKTLFYSPGVVLDERTKKIQNPKITLDRQSISGVAMGEPARFKVYMTNDSEQPEAATGSISLYVLYLKPKSNPNGAKIMVDGIALTTTGWELYLKPGEVVERTLEVYAGTEFDYEGLKIGLCSKSDPDHISEEVAFDVHYLHQAGPVNISSPGDKWVMNTYASKDDKRGWFIPVTIDGFDRHQHNFDHIEFQYKESQRGDDSWTNLCSFYADSLLMAKASGEREMIPENGNIVTNFYGEGTVMEKAYDLRAVLYCRNGNSFLTTSSKIISGVKDTRRPQLFGTSEPVNGILTTGDNIVFNFSEDIEYNYLSAITNFEVKGETNTDHISENVSVQFTGQSSMETEAMRNFSGKDLTIDLMIKPDTLAGRDMPLFSHGSNGQKLQLWLTENFKLKAVINNHEYVSDSVIKKNTFTQVAMCMDLNDDSLRLFNGGKVIGRFPIIEHYNGTGNLIFGRTNESDRSDSKYYEGRMMEARLWYAAMDGALIGSTYGGRRLTGYEVGLVDYYPMNEGSGNYALDKTQGANAQLIGTNWAMPRGFSLRIENDDHGIKLTKNALNRTKEQDYTLMFWFKTDSNGRGVLLSNGAGKKDEIGAKNIFNIAFEANKLMYRSNGQAIEVPGDWSDNEWHHFAMTMNRGLNIANIYVDQVLRSSFEADSIGGISGGHPLIGAALYDSYDADGKVITTDTRNWLIGHIDELCFFAQALPETLINTYSKKSPNGDEVGLLTYLSFDRQERQKNNEIVMVPYEYSKKIYLDADGNMRYELDPQTKQPTSTPMRDYVFVDSIDVIKQHITDNTAAPVIPYEELKNLNFSFVGEGHKLLVNLNEKNSKLNRRNIYVTIRDVEDKNGNAMASPQTACYLVTNSNLHWIVNRYDYTTKYGAGETGELSFYNNGATSHTYTIENCPKWLKLSKYSDVIAPQNMEYVEATISKDLNVGTYNEILYLTDEQGVSEPFYLNLTVEGEQPGWAESINSDLLKYSMSISGQVYLFDELDTDERDIVGVFDKENVCHGFANISHNAQTGETGLYLTVYDNQTSGRPLNFRMWQYSTGREIVLSTKPAITFSKDAILGTDKPVRFDGGEAFVQYFDLKAGWNWISFNVASEQLFNLNTLLDGLPWKEGDVLTDLNSDATLVFRNGHWLISGDANVSMLSQKKAYAIMVQDDIRFPIAGTIIKQADMRTIEVKQGWNGIGYTPALNLTVETALSDYFDKAEPGDVIKSHDQFAYFSKSGNVGRWRGNLQYMKPGEGYMLLRKAASTTTFTYPFYEPGSTFLDEWSYSGTTRSAAPVRAMNTMCVSAVVDGFEVEEGDILEAYANGEIIGKTTVNSASADETREPIYLSIEGDKEHGIWFAIERGGEIVAFTNEQMTFIANAVIGSPDEPTSINFIKAENENDQWYSISGIKLQKKPTQSGMYIFNGRKILIK